MECSSGKQSYTKTHIQEVRKSIYKTRAKKFYSEVFGWEISDMPIGGGEIYTGATTTPVDQNFRPKEPGAINGDLFDRDEKLKNPVITINVSSIEESFGKIEAAGGEKLIDKGEVPQMGYYAYFKDTEGNIMGLWEDIHK